MLRGYEKSQRTSMVILGSPGGGTVTRDIGFSKLARLILAAISLIVSAVYLIIISFGFVSDFLTSVIIILILSAETVPTQYLFVKQRI